MRRALIGIFLMAATAASAAPAPRRCCDLWIFEPSGGSAKFARFHEALRCCGATRSLPETVAGLTPWTYAPIDSAAAIAAEIERRWLRRQAMLQAAPNGGKDGV